MQTQTISPIPPSQLTTSKKSFSEFDFFRLIKHEHLTDIEKQKWLNHMATVVLLNFINTALPTLLSPQDLETLEKMTERLEAIDIMVVQNFLRSKIKNYDVLMQQKMVKLKKQLIKSHYQKELKILEIDQRLKGIDHLAQILTIQRLLQAVDVDDWNQVAAIVPQTKTPETH